MNQKLTVVLRHENEYDQRGAYFVAIFTEDAKSPNGHWGRVNYENTWYTKEEIETNTFYEEDSEIHR